MFYKSQSICSSASYSLSSLLLNKALEQIEVGLSVRGREASSKLVTFVSGQLIKQATNSQLYMQHISIRHWKNSNFFPNVFHLKV